MKLMMSLLLTLIGLNSFAAGGPCLAIGQTDKGIIKAAIDASPNFGTITTIVLERLNAFQNKVTITSYEKVKTVYKVEQVCETGELKVTKEEQALFQCTKSYINCMPPLTTTKAQTLCSAEFAQWHVKNCGAEPLIAH